MQVFCRYLSIHHVPKKQKDRGHYKHWKQIGGYGVWRHFQQYFIYIMEVTFIGGGNQSTWRKLPICCKLLTNFIT
jgi:hypothetical protein